MTREEAIKIFNEVLLFGDAHCTQTEFKELAKMSIQALEQEPITNNDLALIHTYGLDEGIRCAMCTNSMRSDRGCDGGCVVNNAMYKKVMDVLEKHIKPTTKNDLGVDAVSRALPSVTPIRPKGHWIETAEEYYKAINEKGGGVNEDTDYFVDDIACSECLAKFSVIDNEAERFDFCPCCGSDNR